MLPQQSYSHIVNTCGVPTTVLGAGNERMNSEKTTIIMMVIDDDDKYVIVYMDNRSNPILQALTQSLQFNEKYYMISIL